MEPAFDSFSQSSSDRCTGPNSFFNTSSLPSPTSPTHPIVIPACSPRISVTHRPVPRRGATTRFDNASKDQTAASFQRAQAPADNFNIASILTSPQGAYLSSPNTDSQLCRAHPLPSSFDIGRSSLFFTVAPEGTFGILDSPLVMRREELRSSPEKPLSPPLTLPLSTLTLPDTDNEFCSAHHDGSEQSTQEINDESQAGVRKDTLSDETEETLSDLLRSEGVDLSKLSPLSPSWKSEMSVIPENSALLGSSSLATRRSRGSLAADRERDRRQPYNRRNRPGPYLNHATGYGGSPPWSADVTLPIVVGGEEDAAHPENMGNEFVSYMPTPLATPQRSDSSSGSGPSSGYGSDSLPTPISPGNLSLNGTQASDLWSPRLSHDFDFDRPFLPPLDIPKPSYHTRIHKHPHGSPEPFIPKFFDDDYSMDVDNEKSAPPPSSMFFPSPYEIDPSPSTSPPSFLSSPLISPSYTKPLPPPSSPSISRLSLPDLDIDLNDNESHPSSPSRRSFASLPDLEMDDPPDIIDIDVDFSAPPPSPSPGQTLLSLPGADTDEDLLPPPAPNFKTPFPPPHPSSPSLLLIDDPRDVPLPRSPSPEDFDFDLNITLDDESDPELTKLYNLRKKSLAAERAARHAEAQLTDAGSISLRAEATKDKKKNKQTSKEVGALLRLKLGDQVAYPSSAHVDGCPKGLISSVSQLVARMMFRRHETFRPLANRKSTSTNHDYVRSSLSQSSGADSST